MTQIKLSIAFVLAAATIAPIVAQPICDGRDLAGNVGHSSCPHQPHHQGVAIPEKSSLEPTSEPVVHSKPEILAREYDEFEEMFERADPEVAESTYPNTFPPHFNGALRSGPGPAVFRPNSGPFTSPRLRLPFTSHGPVVHRPFYGFTSPRLHYGVNRLPVVDRPFNGFTPQRPRIGLASGNAIPRRLGPARHGVVAREYAEFDDMFERDFEDVEFDARDFDDELYLD